MFPLVAKVNVPNDKNHRPPLETGIGSESNTQ